MVDSRPSRLEYDRDRCVVRVRPQRKLIRSVVSAADSELQTDGEYVILAFVHWALNSILRSQIIILMLILILNQVSTRGQSNLTKKRLTGAHSPVRGHPRGSKVVPLNSWDRVSY